MDINYIARTIDKEGGNLYLVRGSFKRQITK